MNTSIKVVVGVLVGAILGLLALHLFGGANQSFGSTVDPNTPWFSNGFKYGKSTALFLSDSLTVAAARDQAVWLNNTGATVVIDTVHVVTNATSSTSVSESTYAVSVGATSTATIVEPYSLTWIVNGNSPLLVDKYSLATSSATGMNPGGLVNRIKADNYANHPASNPSFISVPKGWYLFVKIDSPCTADGSCGKTATSTNRGFTTLTVPFWYHYSLPN